MSEPRMWWWWPLQGKRHAMEGREPKPLRLDVVTTLCGQTLPMAPARKMEWLWDTCLDCDSTLVAPRSKVVATAAVNRVEDDRGTT